MFKINICKKCRKFHVMGNLNLEHVMKDESILGLKRFLCSAFLTFVNTFINILT